MSQHKVLYQWFDQVESHFSHLNKPQSLVLAAFSLGLALARRTTLSAIAEAMASLGKPDTVERRLQRFLSHKGIDHKQCSEALSAWVLRSLRSTGLIVLLVDETSLRDRLKVMAVSLAYRGKAIPLAWWCYPQENWPMGQVELIRTLLCWVAPAIPKESVVLVQADRGIGTSPELLKAIEEMGFYYLVRVQRNVQLILADGSQVSFGELVPKAGSRWHEAVHAFKKAGWLECWAIGEWKASYDEPWLLLTNFPKAQGNWYGLRMWQELAFRDFKSTGWNWHKSHVWKPRHANILWLVMSLAYVWALSLGTHVIRDKHIRIELSRGRRKRHSIFQLGLRYLKRWIELHRKLLCDLVLIPHVPIKKSVVY